MLDRLDDGETDVLDQYTPEELGLDALPAGGDGGPGEGPRRRHTGPSRVYSLRLGHDEITALERRAFQLRVRPSVLARRLIRAGL